ncbi:MAG: choice-of-anchor D domain-containing protein [Methanoregula sp.]|nr:choice-of-anchor D domain-containing protein [Methanoregula sp.]
MKRYSRVLAVWVIAALVLAVPAGAYHICFNKACVTGVTCCEGHGSCIGYNNCTCEAGYSGYMCEIKDHCVMSGKNPVCTSNCTPWGSSAATTSHGACMEGPPFSGTYGFTSSRGPHIEHIQYTINFDSGDQWEYGPVVPTVCACAEGWTGACCSNYQPGTLTPSVLDFGNVTVGAPAASQTGVVLANSMALTNLNVQSITLTGTDSGDFAYTTTCAVNTNVTSLPGNCTFAFIFTPSATGTRIALLNVNVSSDSGANNQIMTTTLTGNGITRVSGILIDPKTPANVFAGLDGAGIFRSINSGSLWTPASMTPATTRIRALAISPLDSSKLFSATYGGGVYRSTDSGASWSVCTNTGLSSLNVISLVADPAGKLYAGTEAGVFTSTDDCDSWTAANTGLPS